MKVKNSLSTLLFVLLLSLSIPVIAIDIQIHSNGKPNFSISIPINPTASQQFSADELAKYLQQITGSKFVISKGKAGNTPAIRLGVKKSGNADDYSIIAVNKDIIMNGNSDRALLYCVYDFLGRLGCQWLAPNFTHYKGNAEIIPDKPELNFNYIKKIEAHPALEYRKLDVAGARENTAENLIKLVEWMPKVRYNTLRLAMDRNNTSKTKWDKWRDDVTPEMQKRGIIIEVGGHGYQNFLNKRMLNGTLFKQHPDWFGKDSLCNYSPSDRLVFNTENPEAVDFFIKNVVDYLKSHPEIEIFDLWPPDVGRWSDCPDWKKYGTPQDRQVRLTNSVNAAIKEVGLNVKTEIIAYSFALLPPEKEVLDEDVLLEICPINQSFEYQINDPAATTNKEYAHAIQAWRKTFKGNITFYSYYRKQAWRSLPNIIPNYLQKDMEWIAKVPLNGISCYAEQGDWFSYELNHYILAHLAWNPAIDLSTLTQSYFKNRYAADWQKIKSTYAAIEEIVPVYGSIPFSTLKSKNAIEQAQKRINAEMATVKKLHDQSSNDAAKQNLSRLLLVLSYIKIDLEIQHERSAGNNKDKLYAQIQGLVKFLEDNSNKGLFILTGNNDFARFTKKYGLTNQSLLD